MADGGQLDQTRGHRRRQTWCQIAPIAIGASDEEDESKGVEGRAGNFTVSLG